MPDQVVCAGNVHYARRLPAVLPARSLIGWLAAFDRLNLLGANVFIPGHGQPGPLSSFEQPTRNALGALKKHMDAPFKAGLDPSAAASGFDASPWHDLANFTELVGRNASLAYLGSEREGF